MSEYVYVWTYRVRPAHVDEFLRRYAPGGDWVRLFRLAPGYLGTTLLRSRIDPLRFATVDRWESHDAFVAFKTAHREAFAALDAECESFTEEESSIGEFDVVPGGGPA